MKFGGPVWHASASAVVMSLSETLAERALDGCGDARLGEWREAGSKDSGVFHIRRRLTASECRLAGRLVVRDIRGTPEERKRDRLLIAALTDPRARAYALKVAASR